VALFEIDIESLLKEMHWLRHRFVPFSRFPSAVRDLALLVDRSVPASEPQRIIEAHPLVVQATLFDVFEEGLATGKKSLALRVELQSATSTLSPEQLTEAMAEIVAELGRKTGATLRA
jgi:phenylalanyl-tRNA synthetase beta chain